MGTIPVTVNDEIATVMYKLMAANPEEWDKIVSEMPTTHRGIAVDWLLAMVDAVARRAAYMDSRNGLRGSGGDEGHKNSVRHSNKVMRTVRKAFGFRITNDLEF